MAGSVYRDSQIAVPVEKVGALGGERDVTGFEFRIESGDPELDNVWLVGAVRRWSDPHYVRERRGTPKILLVTTESTQRPTGHQQPTAVDICHSARNQDAMPTVSDPILVGGSLVALAVAWVVSVVVLHRLEDRRWGDGLRRRLVLGVPWGTAIVVALVLGVYLFVQGALGALTAPLVVPFRSWSYTYPLGMLTAAFAHGSLGHLTGNLLSTVVFATVAEYAWSHYPTERGSQSFAGALHNPYARIGVFVLAVVVVGVATSLFVPGPSIGFSGVVFAFAGFALVTSPTRAILAILGVRIVRTVYYAVVEPAPTVLARQEFVEPWFANVSVQGHAFGLVLGVLLGVWVLSTRRDVPSIRRVWYATLAFVVVETLYALYWYVGADGYRLFRAAGLAAVLVLVVLVTTSVAAARDPGDFRRDLSWRHLAVLGLVAVVVAIGLAAVVLTTSSVTVADQPNAVEVRDYTVFYDEDVPHGYVSAIDGPSLLRSYSSSARASGVIVASEHRDAWEEVVSAGQLAVDGRATVSVGGLGWRERIVVERRGWNAIDGNATYKVFFDRRGHPQQLAYTAASADLSPRIAGANLSIAPTDSGFVVNVTREGTTLDTARVPAENKSVEAGPMTIHRQADSLFAIHEGTRVRLARSEQSGG